MTAGIKKIVVLLAGISLLSLILGLPAWLYLRHALASTNGNAQQIDAFFSSTAQASEFAGERPQPCLDQYPQKRAWYGALHIHTAASFDATAFGVTNTADDAYAFSRGQELELRLLGDTKGTEVPRVRIGTVLDFAAVTDHAGQLGEKRVCEDPDSKGYPSLLCNIYRGDIRLPIGDDMQALVRLASQAVFQQRRAVQVCGEDGEYCRLEARNAWWENQQAAEQWQDQSSNCEFSTFHGYEYTLAENASNLHRNVLFANSTVPPAVVSAKDKQTPELLWDWLRRSCTDSGTDCDVLTIPHNSNWSSGRMWYPYSYRKDLTQAQRQQYATLRQQMEPLVEVMQVKGDSECRNGLSSVIGAADEFCDFEKLRAPSESIVDCDNEMGSGNMRLVGCLSRFSYARYALSNGLWEQEKLGINPFKLGIIAATDNHNATPTAQTEQSYMGANGSDRKASTRLRGEVEVPGGIAKGSPVRYNPGGLAGVWAQENSRQSLFAAMQRRETFGTSGPRIEPRFFSGWSLEEDLCNSSELLTEAYANGVPMGGDLPAAIPGSGSPRFLASAIRDPDSNLLQRIQIIKGWIDDGGRTHQAVYDVAGNPDNGASVDPLTCEVSGSGYHQLCNTWQDPDFDPTRSAVYYARVLENPACRWSTYQCNEIPTAERPASCSETSTDKTIQERAWTSPIWYTAPE